MTLRRESELYTSDRQEWRRWLSEHFETEAEIWLVFPMMKPLD